MHIIGGTYRELCSQPSHDGLYGSGVRAAAALASTGTEIRLHSVVHESEQQLAAVVADTLGVQAEWFERTRPVGFSYFTPLSTPVINGIGSAFETPLSADDDTVLVFGLIESGPAPIAAKGRRVIVDPQRPRNLTEADLPLVIADEQAMTLNERETCQLGHLTDVRAAARRLVDSYGLSVVVTKRGPRGALVTSADGVQTEVAARVSSSVFPIGSGDVFAAAFAWAWGEERMDPIAAAELASNAAAHWCETREYPIPLRESDGAVDRIAVPTVEARPVYLAGPFFNLQQRWLIDVVRAALAPGVWSPLHEVGPGGLEVAKADLDGLAKCDSVIALLDDNDQGTVFEVGWATKLGLPTVMYTERLEPEGSKMLLGTGTRHFADLSTAVYNAQWTAAFRAAERNR